ncbi:MAG: hypothetical protein ACK5CU_02005 [Rhodoluna sp.]
MKRAAFFVAGVAFGVYLAKQIETNPEAKRMLNQAGDKVKTFANAVVVGYKEQEAKATPKTGSKKK